MSTSNRQIPALEELKGYAQWVAWRPETRDGKPTKVPYVATNGSRASSTDPTTWLDFATAAQGHRQAGHTGLGFVAAESDPFCGVDLDKCRDPKTGEVAPWARAFVARLDSYTEVTPSETGLRVWVRGQAPQAGNRKWHVEIYSKGRFFTVTGRHLEGTPTTINERQSEVESVFADATILATADDTTKRLLEGDTTGYNSASEADLALASRLAAHTQDREQLERLLRGSGLWDEKWERDDYRNATIEKALSQPVTEAGVGNAKNSVATLLVGLADEHFRLGRDQDEEPFAVEKTRPSVALPLRGSRGVRRTLAALYSEQHGKAPNASALTDALLVLEGRAFRLPVETVHLRTASVGDAVVLDLGDETGQAVVVRPGGWGVVAQSPVLFRRTRLTSALPVPELGGDLAELRGLLNVSDSDWPLLRAFLLAAWVPNIPHPVLALTGEQGTAKSTDARMVAQLTDPSPAPLRAQPKSLDDWQVAASASHVVVIDNVSSVPDWFSDAVCRASTGDGLVKRELYTDKDVAVLSFRRVVILTAIALPGLRGDLGDRLLLLKQEPIPQEKRRLDRDLEERFTEARPRLVAALLDLLAATLAELPNVKLDKLPRMADFARLVAAADRVTHGHALAAYDEKEADVAGQVIEGDPLAQALLLLLPPGKVWEGTASDFRKLLSGRSDLTAPPRGWPDASHLSAQLNRVAPALRRVGVEVKTGQRLSGGRDNNRQRLVRLSRRADGEGRHPSEQRPPGAGGTAPGDGTGAPLARGPETGGTAGDGRGAVSPSLTDTPRARAGAGGTGDGGGASVASPSVPPPDRKGGPRLTPEQAAIAGRGGSR